ncbi:MAG: metal-dependent transcriptional regulator [Christensenellales bacterium]
MKKLTFTMENYLEAIYELSEDGGGARVSDIAKRLDVTKASTSIAMTALSEKGLIVNEKYGEIYLTEEGRKRAEATSRKHQIILEFFADILQIPLETADQDACSIEHVISGDSIFAMENFLNNYKKDK